MGTLPRLSHSPLGCILEPLNDYLRKKVAFILTVMNNPVRGRAPDQQSNKYGRNGFSIRRLCEEQGMTADDSKGLANSAMLPKSAIAFDTDPT